jgi:methyl-accepting chemotaxis protein
VAVTTVSKEAQRITNNNRQHLESADRIRTAVTELREITSRNADGVKTTLKSTSGLANRARELGEIMDSIAGGSLGTNGNQTETPKRARTNNSRRSRKSPEQNDSETEG